MSGSGDDASVAEQLKLLKDECEAAPRYGVNGRELILKASRLIATVNSKRGNVATKGAGAAAATAGLDPRGLTHGQRQQQAYCSGGLLLDAVPPAERPFAPFVARSFLTQAMRQDCVNRLMGQHLALLLQELGVASAHAVETVRKDSKIRKAAGEAALAQELRIYKDVTNKLAYQARARQDALLKFAPEDQLAALRTAYGVEALDAAGTAAQEAAVQSPVGQHGPDRDVHQRQQLEHNHQQQQLSLPQHHDVQQEPPSIQHPASAASDVANLQAAHEAPEDAAEVDPGHQHAAKRARLAAPGCISQRPGKHPSEGGNMTASETGHAQPTAAEGEMHDLLGDLFDDDDAPGNGGIHAAEAISPGTHAPLQAANDAAAADTTPSILPAAGPSATLRAMNDDEVRQQVHKFVSAVARPLLKSGVIDARVYELVMARAVSKVLERHEGASDAGFLLKECSAITKLVTSYVDFYTAATAK